MSALARRNARRPLAGRRVLVTRDEPRGGPLVTALSGRGAEVHHWPAYRVQLLRPVRASRWATALGGFDWLVFSSAHAVAALEAWGAPRTLGAGRRPRVAVVGAATARAARAAGWRVDCRAAGEGANALVAALRARGVAGCRVVYPASERARPELAAGLRRLRAEVEQVVAYRLRWSRRGIEALRRACARGFDALAFTSPGGVEGLERAIGAARLSALLAATPAVAIGETTRRALATRSRRRVRVAARATIESTAAAITAALARARRAPRASLHRIAPRRSPR